MPPSVRSRFTATVISNILRSSLGFFTGLLVARSLGPEQFGNFTFLLGSFVALKQLLDMGTSSAFYTFISQKQRPLPFMLSYFGWQGLQFFITVLAVGLVMPHSWVEQIWLGQDRNIILLSFVAVFLQQQAWQTLIQVGEASRLTRRVQGMNVVIAAAHLALVIIFWRMEALTVQLLFSLIIVEYVFALILSYHFIWRKHDNASAGTFAFGEMLEEYGAYCAPLVVYYIVLSVYAFADRWMLQSFGGPAEQGFYAIGYQFAAISLLATTSILQIFWKEIAEAQEQKNIERIRMLYHKVSRSLFMVGAVISGFLIPWSGEIINTVLGAAYIAAAPALAVMFLYPVHQSMGQITGTMFLATGKTKPYTIMGMLLMLISIPVSYIILAPADARIPGFGLGSTGLAIKMVVLQLIGVNVYAWYISRMYNWKFDWLYQVIGLGGAVLAGWLAYASIAAVTSGMQLNLFLRGGLSFVLYALLAGGMIWATPWLVGMDRMEIREMIRRMRFL